MANGAGRERARLPRAVPEAPAARLRLPISLVLVAGFGGLVLLGIASVLVLGIASASRNTFDLLTDKASIRLDVIETRIRGMLDPAAALALGLTEMVAAGRLEPTDQTQVAATLRGALAGLPQVTGLHFSDADFRTVAVGRWAGARIETRLNRNHEIELIRAASGLAEAIEPYWQNIVWLAELGQPALNLNVPLRRDGEFVGGLIIVVSLDSLVRFVASLEEPDAGGVAFILLGRDHVLAHPAMIAGGWQGGEGAPLPRREQLDDPALALLGQDQVDHVLTTAEPPPYIAPLPAHDPEHVVFGRLLEGFGAQPWIIGQSYVIETVGMEVRRLFRAGIAGLVILVVAVVLALLLGRRLARRIHQLAAASDSLKTLDFAAAPVVPDSRFRELANAGHAFNAMIAALGWFEMYVPKSLVLRLMRHGREAIVTSHEREVTVMFTDIQGFSAIAQKLGANQVAELLNEHFGLLADAIEAEGGTVDKYIGDSVMAFWGAPDDQPDQAERAVRAARAITAALGADDDRRRAAGMSPVRLRIGINTGPAVVGNIGSASRVNYTLVGDTVNVAERLEGLAKAHHGDEDVIVLVSQATAAQLGPGAGLESLGAHQLRGLEGQVEVFRLSKAP